MNIRGIFWYDLSILKSLTLRRLFNFIQVQSGFLLSRISHRVFVFGKPWAASIEPTTACNLRCPECPTGMQSLSREKGNMSIEVFQKILDKLSPNLFYLTLYLQGEPFLNPGFTEMVRVARKQKIFVSTSTNGHFLSEKNVDQIIESGLNHLIISLDGLDQTTYEKYRVNGNFQTVIEGIKRLVDQRNLLKSKYPFIELQFLVTRHNQHQMQEMRTFAKHTGVDKLAFKTAQVYHFEKASTIIPTLKSKSRYKQNPDGSWMMAKNIRNHCHRIWSYLVVTWDGKVVPCCYDKNADYQTGKILEEPLSALWKNQLYYTFRKRVLDNRSGIDICRNCGE